MPYTGSTGRTMRTLIHVSDLHFGRADHQVIGSLIGAWQSLKPDVVIISGDLTQRAEVHEFRAARAFLDAITAAGLPYLVIPGNHDIAPVYRPLERILAAYQNYRTYISEHTEQYYHDDELAIACLNTVQRSQLYNGRFTAKQLALAKHWFDAHPTKMKIVVTHHPLRPNHERGSRMAAFSGRRAHKKLEALGVDVFLSGHHHFAHVERTHAISIHAGTVSERLKGEPASFNVLRIQSERVAIDTYHWVGTSFELSRTTDTDRRKKKIPLRMRVEGTLKRVKTAMR